MAKSNQARVNGGSNYDSLKVAKCLVIVFTMHTHTKKPQAAAGYTMYVIMCGVLFTELPSPALWGWGKGKGGPMLGGA